MVDRVMLQRQIVLNNIGDFHDTYPLDFYFYLKIIGDIEHRNIGHNLGLLLARILVHNNEYLNSIFDVNICWRIGVNDNDKLFQNFRKWVER